MNNYDFIEVIEKFIYKFVNNFPIIIQNKYF